MRRIYFGWLVTIFFFSGACAPDLPEDVSVALEKLPDVDYNLHVKPILSDKCFACHGPDKAKQKAGLRLDVADIAYGNLPENPGKVAIKPGNLRQSEVVHRILSNDPEYVMPEPSSHLTLSTEEKAILIKWIDEGAVYKPHWSLVKPELPVVPEADEGLQTNNAIDHFVLRKLKKENLMPAKEAEKELLLRRVSLDLTGLPPTLEEIESFVNDPSSDAYEKQVDRLLSSPHYGEKMAVDWLDLARFADSHGYTVDRLRDMSPYRDWVIKAFNENFPYDKFVHWQLAGDMMPDPTREMLIATAFNRNHQQNMEGGIVEEEFQAEYVADRTNTFGDAFLGLSLGCAKCHDHKFDPVSQKEYFELYSFFNNVREAGQISWDDAMPSPTMLLPTEEQERKINFIHKLIAEQELQAARVESDSDQDFQQWLKLLSRQPIAKEVFPLTGLIALYDFDQRNLKNKIYSRQAGVMRQQSGEEKPDFISGKNGSGLQLNGDVWLDLNEVGVFRRSDPFSIGLWVNIPGGLSEGVIFHKGIAERLYNFRGYHLYLKNSRLEANLAYAAPSNAITRVTSVDVPRDRWVHLAMTYDGSSSAQGLRLYVDGREAPLETVVDQLTKEILFKTKKQPGLQIGAWDRGYGLKGGKVDQVVVYDRVLAPVEVLILTGEIKGKDLLKDRWSEKEIRDLKEYYLSVVHPENLKVKRALRAYRTDLAEAVEPVQELMIMTEMPEPKQSYILERGEYNAPGEEVFPNTPAAVLAFPEDLPRNRYGLAQWLTHRDNPLTARVAVNRIWQNFFGAGLVKTTEDFGSQGELPSHAELLDWLAITFRESGWDVKALNKLIVMSATYRQDSRATPGLRELDPDNRLLARGPAGRLSAEMIRDNVLAASGLLNRTIGGKSVKPYQPAGLWQINNATYVPDTGAAVYRRSLYVLVKRSVPNPTLSTFDGNPRSYCVVRRQTTDTPLQALVTLNDPTFVEASLALGKRMAETKDIRNAIGDTFRKLTGRTPSQKELDLLADMRTRQLQRFKAQPEKAEGWLNAGQSRVEGSHDRLAIAANAVVANTILNADATLTKR